MEHILRLTQSQLQEMHSYESTPIIAACGQRATSTRICLAVHSFFPVDTSAMSESDLLTRLSEFRRRKMVLLPVVHESDSPDVDDSMVRLLAQCGQPDHGLRASVDTGGRVQLRIAESSPFIKSMVCVVGNDLQFWSHPDETTAPCFSERHEQVFGAKTTTLLRRLTVAVIGCSGTGSPIVEQLARLGVGKLILVDPDRVEVKNLNRILNTTHEDAIGNRPKAEVLAEAVRRMGLDTEVVSIVGDLYQPNVLLEVAASDVLFGCMDTVEGRHVLNRLSAVYTIPYFDIGVGIKADGRGGITQAGGSIHYLRPGGSSLLSREVYTLEELRSESLRRTDPAAYADQLRSGYISGVMVDAPAVISLNMQLAAMAVNEFLARLHPYRSDDNELFDSHRLSLKHGFTKPESHPVSCPLLVKYVGRGDMTPLLDMPSLSSQGLEECA